MSYNETWMQDLDSNETHIERRAELLRELARYEKVIEHLEEHASRALDEVMTIINELESELEKLETEPSLLVDNY